ncbi:IclR family transcriptional regulator C-terminal domain-containing protein [Sphingomonas sp. UYEF23]|uniref:IclR family transcriptional regulator domain-containing protein n=1 Tax=Sphingomonas sp. UYEF23 TaxID=1756408 RepID=UPI003391CA56
MPLRPLRRFYDADPSAIAAAGLGENWGDFRKTMRQLARPGVLVSQGEIDAGVLGIAAPIFRPDGQVIDSISLVVRHHVFAQHPQYLDATVRAVRDAGVAVSSALHG